MTVHGPLLTCFLAKLAVGSDRGDHECQRRGLCVRPQHRSVTVLHLRHAEGRSLHSPGEHRRDRLPTQPRQPSRRGSSAPTRPS
jgi:hypothetical protein